MRAVVCDQCAPLEVERPVPRDDEVLVRIRQVDVAPYE
jgi:hypothetical protein